MTALDPCLSKYGKETRPSCLEPVNSPQGCTNNQTLTAFSTLRTQAARSWNSQDGIDPDLWFSAARP